MRTTLTLDDDLAAALKQRVRQLEQPFDQVVNDTLRYGLSLGITSPLPTYRVEPHHSGFRPGIDPTRLNQINDVLKPTK